MELVIGNGGKETMLFDCPRVKGQGIVGERRKAGCSICSWDNEKYLYLKNIDKQLA